MRKETSILQQLDEAIELKLWLKGQVPALLEIASRISGGLRRGNKVLFLGNGGSAADGQHLAAELAGRFRRDREPLPAMGLTENVSSLTAIANDYGYEYAFSRQIRAMARPGDVVVGISTSGSSPNVLRAIEEAKSRGALTIALTGLGGKLEATADHALVIPSRNVARIQETYMTAGHLVCYLVEEELFGHDFI
jgi:D-sedoheptulose 7-phosphate isomerase